MRTINETDAEALREALRAPGPVASIYFRREPRPRRDKAELRWHALAESLAAQRAGEETIKVLDDRVRASLPGSGMLAAFAAGDRLLYAADLPEASIEDQAVCAATPHLLPLLEWWQEHPAHVFAVVDRTGADVEVFPQGSTEAIQQTVIGPDDEIVRNAPGGWSQMRYQRRAEDSWDHNAGQVARILGDDLAQVSADLLLLAGDVRAVQYLTRHLPPWVRQRVAIHRVAGSRGEAARDAAPAAQRGRHAEELAEETRRAVDEECGALLHRIAEERHRAGRAVEGPHATLAALARGQVNTLVVTEDPADRRRAWFGPAPTAVADQRRAAEERAQAEGGGTVRRGPLADVAVRAAVLTGADVRVLRPGTAGAPAHGIGALCRYSA
jgi:peptide subunit release factor 1 (eRF1)